MARVLHWNGKDVPPELYALPPGDYVVEPVEDEAPPLTPDEEEGIRAALASAAAGRTLSADDVRRSIDKIIKP